VLAARALRLLPGWRRRGDARLVRFLSRAGPIAPWPWHRWLFGAACDGLVCVSDQTVRENRRIRGGRTIAATTGAVALASLSPARSPRAVRRVLGVPEEAPLIAVVARMQRHRGFDLLLAALRELLVTHPEARLLVIGRGTHADEVVGAPARAMGIESRIVHAGYRSDDYADVLTAADCCTYLVPGSDGTCRALLEAAALGLPLVGSRRGAIPDIISNGQTGRLVEETPEDLASAWRALLEDPGARRAMGRAARADARVRFSPDRQAAWIERFYREVLAASGASS
jgi:glycosyltransferase involved in cell wall biosynthesis